MDLRCPQVVMLYVLRAVDSASSLSRPSLPLSVSFPRSASNWNQLLPSLSPMRKSKWSETPPHARLGSDPLPRRYCGNSSSRHPLWDDPLP